MSSRKSKTPTRSSPTASAKPSTPTIMKIDEVIQGTKEAMESLIPGTVATLGVRVDDLKAVIDHPSLLRSLLLALMVTTVIVCIVFFIIGSKDAHTEALNAYTTNKLGGYLFNGWFAILLLLGSAFGYLYILMNVKNVSVLFVLVSAVYMTSLGFLFYNLYFDLAKKSAIVEIFSYILLVDLFFLGMIITQECTNYTGPMVALLPTLVYAGFLIYNAPILRAASN